MEKPIVTPNKYRVMHRALQAEREELRALVTAIRNAPAETYLQREDREDLRSRLYTDWRLYRQHARYAHNVTVVKYSSMSPAAAARVGRK